MPLVSLVIFKKKKLFFYDYGINMAGAEQTTLSRPAKRPKLQQITKLGQSTYGTVFMMDSGRKAKKIFKQTMTDSTKQLRQRQKELNEIDPHRSFLGAPILEYQMNQDDQQRPPKSIIMVNQGHTLNGSEITASNWIVMARRFQSLIQGICTMSDRGYMHGDIKIDNIVIHPETGVMKFIDYDFFTNNPDDLYIYQYYFAWPPELMLDKDKRLIKLPAPYKTVLQSLDGPRLSSLQSMMAGKTTMINDPLLIHLYEKLKKSDAGTNSSCDYFCNILGMNKRECRVYKAMLNGHIPKQPPAHPWLRRFHEYMSDRRRPTDATPSDADRPWFHDIRKVDIYSLGIVAMTLFGRTPLRTLIEKMIEPDPVKRILPRDALADWQRILGQSESKKMRKPVT